MKNGEIMFQAKGSASAKAAKSWANEKVGP